MLRQKRVLCRQISQFTLNTFMFETYALPILPLQASSYPVKHAAASFQFMRNENQ